MKIAGWFRRNNTLMAQAKDLARQLQEAWKDNKKLSEDLEAILARYDSIRTQFHRVARERDECYRQKRLADMRHAAVIKEMQSAIDEMLETIENEEE